jgi:hypothetical protein
VGESRFFLRIGETAFEQRNVRKQFEAQSESLNASSPARCGAADIPGPAGALDYPGLPMVPRHPGADDLAGGGCGRPAGGSFLQRGEPIQAAATDERALLPVDRLQGRLRYVCLGETIGSA